jgi:hypothetical protein
MGTMAKMPATQMKMPLPGEWDVCCIGKNTIVD